MKRLNNLDSVLPPTTERRRTTVMALSMLPSMLSSPRRSRINPLESESKTGVSPALRWKDGNLLAGNSPNSIKVPGMGVDSN